MPEPLQETYIDEIALRIAAEVMPANDALTPTGMRLFRIYATLCRAKGEATTSEDVHDAWSAWQVELFPEHRSIVPFDQLAPDVQALDDKYRDAIHVVARYYAGG
mgnify:FL=1